MTTRKSSTGKAGAKKLKVKKQTLKDLDAKSGKKVAGGLYQPASEWCRSWGGACNNTGPKICPQTGFTQCACGTQMTQCKQITCA